MVEIESTSRLQREIRQNRPFHSPAQEAILALFRTADILRRQVADVLSPVGVTHQQYNVLRILRGAGEEGLPTLAIADRMIERTPGVTRLVDRLAAKGWVTRERVAGDRRRVQCHITDEGLELLETLDQPILDVENCCLAMLARDDQRRLIDLLDQIRGGLPDR